MQSENVLTASTNIESKEMFENNFAQKMLIIRLLDSFNASCCNDCEVFRMDLIRHYRNHFVPSSVIPSYDLDPRLYLRMGRRKSEAEILFVEDEVEYAN